MSTRLTEPKGDVKSAVRNLPAGRRVDPVRPRPGGRIGIVPFLFLTWGYISTQG